MCKVLIVDDEPAVRNTLKTLLSQSSRCEIVGQAQNGVEGIALTHRHQPDIIIVDINMPKMNGIEMIEKLREERNPCITIILTAFNEFEYAKKAIKLNVLDYLLKPIKKTELIDVMDKAMLALSEHEAPSDSRQHKRMLRQLIQRGSYDANKEDIEMALGILPQSKMRTLLFDLSSIHDGQSVNKVISRVVHDLDSRAWYMVDEGQHAVVLVDHQDMDETDANQDIYQWAQCVQDAVFAQEGVVISAGIGGIYTPDVLYKSHQEATMALEYRFVITKDIICFEDCHLQGCATPYPRQEANCLINALAVGDRRATLSKARKFNQYLLDTSHNPVILKQYCTRFGLDLLACIKKLKLLERVEVEDERCFYHMERFATIKDYADWLLQILRRSLDSMVEKDEKEPQKDFKKVVEHYIMEHYHRDIGLADIADAVGLSSSYFSMLFKKKYEVNFVEYLTMYRVERAKSYLQSSRITIKDVASLSGFHNAKYFFRVFKRLEGITPAEYRSVHLQENQR